LYDLRANLQSHVIALLYRYEFSLVVVAFGGEDNHGDGVMMMEITPVRWRWRSKAQERLYHITYYNCM
jgi:hypothetical protein